MRVVTVRALAIAIAIATSWGTSSQATNIFSNPITDGAPQTFNPFTAGQTFDTNITVTGIGRGSGVGANAASNRYNGNNWAFPGFDDNDYFTFTLTPNAGYEIDFASITGTWQRSNTGPKSYLLKTSLDSFATTVTSGDITGNASAVAYNIDLSSIQNVTTPIEIRLYAGGNTTNGATGGTFSFNDFTFDGSVNQVEVNPGGVNGDFNSDGVVDAGDYATWLKNVDTSNALANDNGLGTPINTAHFDLWRANFGNPEVIGGGAGFAAGITVPEPSATVQFVSLLVALTLAIAPQRKRHGRRATLEM